MQLQPDEGAEILSVSNSLVRHESQVERAYGELEKRHRSLVELSPDAILTVDLKGFITSCNSATVRLTGFSREEIVGKHFTRLGCLKKDLMPEYRRLFGSILKGKLHSPIEIAYRRKDGSDAWAKAHIGFLEADAKKAGLQLIVRDITECKKIERVSQSEEKWRGLVETSPDAVVTVDTKGRIVSCNTSSVRALGCHEDQIVGKHFLQLGVILPADVPKYLKLFASILRGKMNEPFKVVWRNGNGEFRVADVHVGLIKSGDKTVGLQAICRDVTEAVRTREKLRESEENFRRLFENARDVIATFDLRGNITSINRFATEYGFRLGDLVGKSMLQFIPKRSWPKVLEETAKLARGKPVEGEIEITTPKGMRTAEYRSTPIRVGKKIVGFQTILRDVTERNKMKEKLKQYSERLEELVQKRTEKLLESEKRYSVLVDEAREGVAIFQDEKLILANKRAAEILGYTKQELIGLSYDNFMTEKHNRLVTNRYYRRMRGEKIPSTYEIEVLTKKGEHVPLELSATPIQFSGRPADLIIFRDIRERKQLEEERLKLEKLATLGEMATMIAHDLRNPLTAIRNAAFYLKKCPHAAEPECRFTHEMLDVIEQETLFADNVINDLLDFTATRPLLSKKQNMNDLLDNFLSIVSIPENIEVKKGFTERVIASVDKRQLERVVQNIVKNAVQAMPDGGQLLVTTKETEDYVEMGFTDTGLGIKEENMEKIFTPFFTTKSKGIGMGLSIVKRVVELHNGKVYIKSKVGGGTSVTVRLPKNAEANG